MWCAIPLRCPVWYFDATGSVLKQVHRQNAPYLYSMVCHDINTEALVSVADFITTSHTSVNVAKYLFSLKHVLNSNMTYANQFKIAPIIVTDFSWALLNAVCDIFNACTISEYLKYSFELVFNGKKKNGVENFLNTHLYICAAHFLKIIIKEAKAIQTELALDHVIRAFIYKIYKIQHQSYNLSNI
jgi:hypothetical protein